ncbi:ABC transporter substrate-binding protein [Gorillibacterium massiliense]|uniref:ABC transporter substrate-binding protein n=1 Tax=Gorillibacterium massiliense TaxID=1280390 RepID=UPI0004B323A5|nr:ABC transporter substrate-binding protein [Gorillibacterium massiliense]
MVNKKTKKARKVKRAAALIAALALTAALLPACGEHSSGAASPSASAAAAASLAPASTDEHAGHNMAATSAPTAATAQLAAAVDKITDNYVLKIGFGGGLCEAALHIAIEKGFFDEAGLKYTTTKVDSATSLELISTKKIDASFGLLAKMVQPIENGLDVQLVTGVHTGCIRILVPANSPIKSLADLKGKRIGVPGLASSPAMLAQRALARAGVGVTEKKMEVEFVNYAAADLPLALKNGAVDAIAHSDPQAIIAEKDQNLKELLNTATDPYFKNEYCCVAYLRRDIIKEHPDVAAAFARAVQKGAHWVEEHPEEAAKLQVDTKWVPGDPVLNGQVLASYDFRPSGSGAKEALKLTAEDLKQLGLLKASTNIDELVERSYIHLPGVEDNDVTLNK